MFVMLFKSVHSIIAIHCDIRYINTLKVVSLSCILQYGDASMYHPISNRRFLVYLKHLINKLEVANLYLRI